MSTNRVIVFGLIGLGTLLYMSFVGYGVYQTLQYGGQLPDMMFNIVLILNLIVVGIGLFVATRAVRKYSKSIQPMPELDEKPYDKYTTDTKETEQETSDTQEQAQPEEPDDYFADDILENSSFEDENNVQ